MNKTLIDAESIINNNISGFHIYKFGEKDSLSYVSKNLSDMIGFLDDELLGDEDNYSKVVHYKDYESYKEFLKTAKKKKGTNVAQYRLIKKDGSTIYVKDTLTVKEDENNNLWGYSTLTDITDLKEENNSLRILNNTIPCGFLNYTCEKQPQVTYMNTQMTKILRVPPKSAGEMDYLEMLKNNLFLMIPMEERHRFALYLNRVYSSSAPIAGETTLLRCDGTKAHILGLVSKVVNENGVEEFQSVCIDITERYQERKAIEDRRYIDALTKVYDKIFEYNIEDSTVRCIHSNNSPMFNWIENVSMQMEDATQKWITDTIVEEDAEKVSAFFRDFCDRKLFKSGERIPQITYRGKSHSGEIKHYTGIFIKIDEKISLYCCRCISSDNAVKEALKGEIGKIKENIQEIMLRFTDGIAAFEINGNYVTPLYASDNLCEFFGFNKEEWISLMKKGALIKEFISRSYIKYEDYNELLNNGEAQFTYYDLKKQKECHIKAICSQKNSNISYPLYVMLYNMDDEQKKNSGGDLSKIIYIRTFGYFDVFVNDKPIAFKNKKAKELFALLVDRKGGYVSSAEAISFLWEDEPVTPVTLSRYRKVALRLKNILEEYGISDVVESVDGTRRIVTERVHCDLYDYISGKEEYSSLFKGSYLTNYSWAETTLGELLGEFDR